jgi:putative ABC transport system substrate-binding protein
MRRREFIAVVGSTAAWTLVAHAQQLKRRIGYLSGNGNQLDRGPFLEAMLRGLEEFGYIEGKNIIIEYRGAEAKEERIPGLISEGCAFLARDRSEADRAACPAPRRA